MSDLWWAAVAAGAVAAGTAAVLAWPGHRVAGHVGARARASGWWPGRPGSGKGKGISLLVPFRSDGERRTETWRWLEEYWQFWLPGAEIIMGRDGHFPFCKTGAVNDAFRRARGDIVVILDADCYIDHAVILSCASQIRAARRRRRRMWFVPYRHFYRLTDAASRLVLDSYPQNPYRFGAPPPAGDVEESSGQSVGHWYGALIQIMPKEAFEIAGGMDLRFRGWGAEDISFMNAVDTLYARHRTTRNQVLHMWHPHIGTLHVEREWVGQDGPGGNNQLATRYQGAYGRPDRMRALTREAGAGGIWEPPDADA
jgi:hypothetical protein